jgi:hypothetical protein
VLLLSAAVTSSFDLHALRKWAAAMQQHQLEQLLQPQTPAGLNLQQLPSWPCIDTYQVAQKLVRQHKESPQPGAMQRICSKGGTQLQELAKTFGIKALNAHRLVREKKAAAATCWVARNSIHFSTCLFFASGGLVGI